MFAQPPMMPHPTSSSLATATSESKRRSRSLSRSRLSWSNRRSSPNQSSSFLMPEKLPHSNLQDAYKTGLDSTVSQDRKGRSLVSAGDGTAASSTAAATTTTATTTATTITTRYPSLASPLPLSFLPRESISAASESTDSSPTTTSSTFDSPIVMETSPSSSPESPTSITPLGSLRTHGGDFRKPEGRMVNSQATEPLLKPPPQQHQQKPAASEKDTSQPESSPSRKARNLKNLSLRLPQPGTCRNPPLSTAPIVDSARNLSAPPSPMPQHATAASKRKPPNLTIQTPGFNRQSFAVPATPTTKPSLRHAESSPSLNSILSPTFPDRPPMTFQRSNPAKRPLSGPRDEPNPSTQHLFTQHELLERLNEEDDNPVSRESRKGAERGYPNGPVLIYDAGLYLYLEPNQEEASRFDVIFNVAKEVRNPFKTAARERQDTVMSVWKANVSTLRQNSEPSTATSDATFMSAFEYPPSATEQESESESPSTPKAESTRQPEYIHVPWDHNSEILDDLYTLCEMIDDRLSQGKSVLIHCQLGVSRSASLVIAYGLYKNRELDFNSVYGLVKARSCWVGPNMSLIYQLTDFRAKLQDKSNTRKQPLPEWLNSPVVQEKAPQLPLPQSTNKSSIDSSPAFKKPTMDSTSSSGLSFFTHNPFSLSRLTGNNNNNNGSSSSRRNNISPRPLPLREKYQTFHTYRRSTSRQDSMFPSRSFFKAPQPAQDDVNMAMSDQDSSNVGPTDVVADTIFSPKTTNPFTMVSPFSPGGILSPGVSAPAPTTSGVGLGVDAVRKSLDTNQSPPTLGRPTVMYDPRSPQQPLEPIIMRNIDEFL